MRGAGADVAIRALSALHIDLDDDRSGLVALRCDLEQLVRLLAELLEEHRGPGQKERAGVVHHACQRAADGVTVDVILDAHRNVVTEARRVVTDILRRQKASIDEVNGVLEVFTDFLVVVEDLAMALAGRRLGSGNHLITAEQARWAVLEDLLAGGFLSDDEISTRAAEFGLNLSHPHALVLVGPGGSDRRRTVERRNRDGDPPVPAMLSGIAATLSADFQFAAVVPRMTAPIPHVVVLARCGPREWPRLRDLTGTVGTSPEVSIIVVPPVTGPRDICRVYMEARDAFPLAMLVMREKRVIQLDDLLIYQVLLGRPEDRHRFLAHVLGPVLAHAPNRRDPLVDALQAYYDAGGDIPAAAAGLHVHENTVRYRLRRLEELTGLSVRHPRDQVWLFLALHLLAFTKLPG